MSARSSITLTLALDLAVLPGPLAWYGGGGGGPVEGARGWHLRELGSLQSTGTVSLVSRINNKT